MSIIDIIRSLIRLIFKRIPKDVREKAEKAKHVVDVIRNVVNNPALVLITELTRTPIDNKVLECLQEITSWLGGESIQEIPIILRGRSEKDRNGTLLKIGSTLLSCMDDGKMKENQYDLAMQAVVSNTKLA